MSRSRCRLRTALAGVLALAAVGTAACSGGGGSSASSQTKGVTITVAFFFPSPKASLQAFTAETGIKVKWTTLDYDSLQTKIGAAATAKTYFADITDVDWSRVGQFAKLDWFYPMETLLDTKSLASAMPQLTSFTVDKHVIGIPFDASFLVTTVNKDLFAKAGITTMPTTIAEYTDDLRTIKSKGVVPYPLNIPFAAAEGLSTYWYQTTAAFGGSVLDASGKPLFASPASPGYKAAQWMVDAIKTGLVPPGNINVTDSQGQQTLMAKGTVASTFGDYSGNVGSLYDVPASSSVVGKVAYLSTPGVSGAGPNIGNPDGIGIPRESKYPQAAAKLISWLTDGAHQAAYAGADGPAKVLSGYFLPSRVSGVQELTQKGKLIGGAQLADLLRTKARPAFPTGPPTYYPDFSRTAYTDLHAAAAGTMSVDAAIKDMAAKATSLATGGS